MLALEQLERFVVFLLVQAHAGQPQPRNGAHVLVARVLDGPRQPRCAALAKSPASKSALAAASAAIGP